MIETKSRRNIASLVALAILSASLIFIGPPAHAATGGNGVCETLAFPGGNGQSAGTAWEVSNAEQLKELGDCKSSDFYYKLTANIDLGGASTPWVPIANKDAEEFSGFVGKLDGQGYKISNLYVPNQKISGLFGYVTPGASISNLEIEAATVSGEVAGILAADIKMGVPVENITVSGTVYAAGQDFDQRAYAGGIAGRYAFYRYTGETAASITISNLVFTGSIIDRQAQALRAGGFFGQVGNDAASVSKVVTIQSSSADVKIVQLESSEATGGLVGLAHNLRIQNTKVNLATEIYGGGDFGGVIGSGESFQLDGLSVQGVIHAASNSASIAGLSIQLRDDNDVATFLDPKIENSMVHLSVHSSGSNNEFSGIIRAHYNGVLSKNIVVVSVTGFASNKVSAVRALLNQQSGTAASVAGNLFDNTQTGVVNSLPGANLTSAEALGVSSSSLSEVATLTNRSFDTSTTWNVNGIPYLLKVPGSSSVFKPSGLVSTDGQRVQLYLGAALASSPALVAGDFIVRVNGVTRTVNSATLSSTDSRVIDLELASPVTRLQEVTVQYVQNQSPSIDYPYLHYPAATYLAPFTANTINKVAYGSPIPTTGSLTPTLVESYQNTLITLTGSNLAESVILMKPTWTGGGGAVEVTSTSDTQINFIAPKLPTTSTSNRVYSVTIINRSGTVLFSDRVTYLASPSISAVTPNVGGRGTLVTIQGSNLSSATSVSFNTSVVAISSATSTSVTALAPAIAAGTTVSVAVQGPGWASTLSNAFRYTQSPSLSAISTNSGLTTGGDSVTLTGVTFSGLLSVKFGTYVATIVSSSSTQVVVTTPVAASAGSVSVTIETTGGTSSLSNAFIYIAAPAPSGGGGSGGGSSGGGSTALTTEISTFSIRVLGTKGGTVTVTGLRLEGITALKIGDLDMSISANTSTEVTFVASSLPVGVFDLTIVNPYGHYTYQAAITVVDSPAPNNSFGKLLGYKWTLKFSKNSRTLNNAQIAALRALPKEFRESLTIVCWGYTTAKNPNSWAVAHATKRAEAACSVVGQQTKAKKVVRIRYGVAKSQAMRSAIQFWK